MAERLTFLEHAAHARRLIDNLGGPKRAAKHCRVGESDLSLYQNPNRPDRIMPADVISALQIVGGTTEYSDALSAEVDQPVHVSADPLHHACGLTPRTAPVNFQTHTATAQAMRTPKAPEVKRDRSTGAIVQNLAARTPPKPGQQNRPAVAFGNIEVVNAAETEKRRTAHRAHGEKIIDGFAAPANDTSIPLMERRRFQCAWPVGEPDRAADQMCCGLLATTFAPQQNVGEQFDNLTTAISATDQRIAELERSNRANAPGRVDRPNGTSLNVPSSTPRTRTDRSEEREARRAERVEQEIFKARQRMLGIADKEVMTVQERFDLERTQVTLEREAEAKELESRLARKDITDENFKQLKLIQTQTATLEDRVSSDILARDLADERLAKERALTDLTADLLSLQSGAARTAKERREIELRLLAMAQRRAREDLETELSRTPGLTDGDKQARRDALGQVQAAQSAAVNRQTMSPLEAWRDQSLKTADEIAEAYENVAARGLDALNDGIVDAIMNSKSLGEVFSNVAKQILADLTSIAVRRSITEPLADMLFGGNSAGGGAKSVAQAAKGGGSSSWLSAAFKMGRSFFGFSGGGYTGDGGVLEPAGIVHKGEFVLPQHAVSRIGLPKLEAMRLGALPGFSAGGLVGGGPIPGAAPRQSGPVVFDMRGAFVPEAFMREVEQKVSAGEARMRGEVPGLAVSAVRDAQDRYAF